MILALATNGFRRSRPFNEVRKSNRELRKTVSKSQLEHKRGSFTPAPIPAEGLDLALKASRIGVWVWEATDQRVSWDANMHEIFGVAPGDFGGTVGDALARIHPLDRRRVCHAIKRAANDIAPMEIEFRVIWPDDSLRYVAGHGRAFHDEGGNVLRVVGVSRDITQERVLRDQLRQAQKLESIGRLAGGIAHDFNNMLTVINGYSSQLLKEAGPGGASHAKLSQIHEAGKQAAALTAQLLAFGRKQVLQTEPLVVNDVIKSLEPMLRQAIDGNIELITHLEPSLGLVSMDTNQIKQILLNLTANARDAMPKGGTLTLETANFVVAERERRFRDNIKPGPYVCLTVRDTGTGMDAITRQHLFEAFYTTKPVGRGTGLGLATVHAIAKQSNGWIECTSEWGEGTEFRVYLPQTGAARRAPATQPQQAVTEPGQSQTILVVEDQPQVRRLASETLRDGGYQVLEAANGLEGLTLANRHRGSIDLVLTDVVMPEMSGPELAEALRVTHPALPIVFMSGHVHEVITQSGMPSVDLIQKPFDPDSLTEKIRRLLASHLKTRVLILDRDSRVRDLIREVLTGSEYDVLEATDWKQAIAVGGAGVDIIITNAAPPDANALRALRRGGRAARMVPLSRPTGKPTMIPARRLSTKPSRVASRDLDELAGIVKQLVGPSA
jgi:two-component system cell cycle sensor histidine kinase/response regulator CckA